MIGARKPNGAVRDLRTGKDVAGVSETARVAATLTAIKAVARAPDVCGDAIPVAPARPRLRTFTPKGLVQAADGSGEYREETTGYRGRSGAMVQDVFDLMVHQARRVHAAKGKDAGPFAPPFTFGQVQAARDYAALSERCAASGVKCSSLEAPVQGGGGGDREAAMFRDFARLRGLHRRIGDGLAKQLRRHRPSATTAPGRKRTSITVRTLVDAVCLGGLSLKEILQANGWAHNGKIINDLRTELCMALDRMQGYRD